MEETKTPEEIEELKRIHGDDVELQPDDSEDEHLEEGQTEVDGPINENLPPIEFAVSEVGVFTISTTRFATRKKAETEQKRLEELEENKDKTFTIVEVRG